MSALTESGPSCRIDPAGYPARFEARVGDIYLACRTCGATGYAPCRTPRATECFVVDEADVVFWGLCPNCQSQRREQA